MFDTNCRHRFTNSLTRWNKYETPLMLDIDFDNFIWVAEHQAFPGQWTILEGMQGLNANQDKDMYRVIYKKHHVFFQLMSLIHMSIRHLLSWWAMIQSVANFGWGIGSTASDINSYWGNTVTSTSCNKRLAGLAKNLVFHYQSLLTKSYAKLFCYDNFPCGSTGGPLVNVLQRQQ